MEWLASPYIGFIGAFVMTIGACGFGAAPGGSPRMLASAAAVAIAGALLLSFHVDAMVEAAERRGCETESYSCEHEPCPESVTLWGVVT